MKRWIATALAARRMLAYLIPALLFVLLAFLAYYQVTKSLYTVAKIDHYVNTAAARAIFFGDNVRSQGSPIITTGYPVLVPVGAALRFFGLKPWVSRIAFSALVWLWIAATVCVLAGYGRTGTWVGTALLVGLLPALLRLGNYQEILASVFGEVPALLAALIALGLIARDRSGRPRPADGLRAGLLFGIAIATKMLMALALPPLAVFVAWPILFSETRRRAIHRAVLFVLGLAGVGIVTTIFRFWLAGGAGVGRYFRDRLLPGGYTYKSAGVTGLTPGLMMSNAAERFRDTGSYVGGQVMLIVWIVLLIAMVILALRAPASPRKRLSYLLLACAAPLWAHFYLIDPHDWLRHFVPGLALVLAGTGGLTCVVRFRCLRLAFVVWLAALCVLKRDDWALLWHLPTKRSDPLMAFMEASRHLQKLSSADPDAGVTSSQYGIPLMFQSLSRRDYRIVAPGTGSRPKIGITTRWAVHTEPACENGSVVYENSFARFLMCDASSSDFSSRPRRRAP